MRSASEERSARQLPDAGYQVPDAGQRAGGVYLFVKNPAERKALRGRLFFDEEGKTVLSDEKKTPNRGGAGSILPFLPVRNLQREQ